MITFEEYQRAAVRTLSPDSATAILAMGLAGEAGELVDYLKKVIGHGHPFDPDHFLEEVGDVLWYLACLCAVWEVDLSSAAYENIRKLHQRYPDGFSTEASIARVDTRDRGFA